MLIELCCGPDDGAPEVLDKGDSFPLFQNEKAFGYRKGDCREIRTAKRVYNGMRKGNQLGDIM